MSGLQVIARFADWALNPSAIAPRASREPVQGLGRHRTGSSGKLWRRANTEISSEDRAILAIAGFVCFISLLCGPYEAASPPVSDGIRRLLAKQIDQSRSSVLAPIARFLLRHADDREKVDGASGKLEG